MSGRLEVLHADNHLLVVSKPAGVPVVPDDSGDVSLFEEAKAWVARTYDKPGAVFLGVVHRLDRPVSGVVCFARTSKAAARLTEAFRTRAVEKVYWALCPRAPEPAQGRLEQWLVKDRTRNRVHAVGEAEARRQGGKHAVSTWRVLKSGRGAPPRVLVELRPETGRSHQLRVAARTLGVPLLGDLKYGAEHPLPDRSIGLHARSLSLVHPTTRDRLTFEAPVPTLEVWSL